MAHLFPWL